MARIANLLTGDTAIPVNSDGDWVFTGCTATITREGTPVNAPSMLVLTPTSPSSVITASLPSTEIPAEYRGGIVDFGCYLKSNGKIEVTITATNTSGTTSLPEGDAFITQTKTFIPSKGSWAFPRVNRISTGVIETPQFVNITIRITNHGGNLIYLARPILVPTFFHLDDEPTEVLLSYLPEEWLDIDANATNVVGAMGKLLHVMGVAYEDCHELHSQIKNLDHVDSYNDGVEEFASTLVSADYIPKERARWLAQFVGTVLIDPSAGLTPWANLPTVWANWLAIDSLTDGDTIVDWSEIEGYNIELIGIEEYFQWQINTQAYSANGGTLSAMKEAITRVQDGTKTVFISHHPTDDWTILIRTVEAETSPLLLASAAYGAKPAGFKLIINDQYLPAP